MIGFLDPPPRGIHGIHLLVK